MSLLSSVLTVSYMQYLKNLWKNKTSIVTRVSTI